ncbi:hypothetical protein QZH41_012828 [Actinostola sp. cb2023]|nr:hypothetical protein QZH41_012828 [Actinostola sp. cb2023]
MAYYKTCGIRGVWLKLPINKSSLIPIAVERILFPQQGFEFHHCFPSFMMMTCWLPNEPNKLPTFATTYIGVGGFVINNDGQLLVVQEKYRKSDHWKLPGGMADHNFRFECSDLYFVCVMKPLNTNINRDPTEISDAKWMDLDEFIASPIVNDANRFLAQEYKDQQPKIVPTEMFLFNRDFVFYSIKSSQPSNKL